MMRYYSILLCTINFVSSVYTSDSGLQEFSFAPAKPKHKDILMALAINSNPLYCRCIEKKKLPISRFEIPDYLFYNGEIELLKRDTEIVGFYSLVRNLTQLDQSILRHLFVKNEYQRQGLGTMLFRRAIATAKADKYSKVTWTSDPDAQDFYLKMNATIVARENNIADRCSSVAAFEYNP